MSAISTIKDLRTRFETKIRGSHDLDDLYDTLTSARDRVEDELQLAASEVFDGSKTASPGDTYLTMKTLPTDWRGTKKMVVDIIPYYPVPFNQRIGYRFSAQHYYIDIRNKQFALTGAVGSAKTINHWYQKQYTLFSSDVESSAIDSSFLIWPASYWPLIIYEAQALFSGAIEADDVAKVLGAAAFAQRERLLDGLIAWDHTLKLQAMGDQLGYAEQDDRPFDVGLL